MFNNKNKRKYNMKKILIPTKLNPIAKKTLESTVDIMLFKMIQKILRIDFEHSDVHGIIVRSEKITSEIIDRSQI